MSSVEIHKQALKIGYIQQLTDMKKELTRCLRRTKSNDSPFRNYLTDKRQAVNQMIEHLNKF